MELEKTYNIQDNFIGIFNNFFSNELIENYLKHFHNCEKQGYLIKRENPIFRKDLAVDVLNLPYSTWIPYNNGEFLEVFFKYILPIYEDRFAEFHNIGKHTVYGLKIQKTKPSEGYHIWHSENNDIHNCNRVFAFTLYLNDVTEGGETEFLYQKCRIKPVQNRFVLWPAAITHIHRGNPPLSNDKYILTGWSEYGV
jgi:hypothetical protein